ncbi:DUF2840 domain-containing protein [Porphyrobacter algicida]|uniref:DUF2840 domain-containing protein n=1 Tax=Qipengyuania algicida TaxID=1836209 RepID=A0A845AIJ4_9SPHN|nr:DUF2840 domain-containing protein [Qipengyuania algicida]
MFGLSGTAPFGLSGTGSSDYREPKPCAKPRNCCTSGPLNYPNKESYGFLLTTRRLCADDSSAPPAAGASTHFANPPLTHVTLVWQEGVREDWLRFGKPVAERIIDRRTRIESYAPRQLFALARWAANDFGTVRSALDIVRAVGRTEPYTTVPQVDPGGELLLSVRTWPRVRRVLALIDAVEAGGTDPCAAAPDYWRHAHNRLAAGLPPRAYAPGRHRVWLRRRKLWP